MKELPTSETTTGAVPLAHWHFTAEQWKEFRYYEKLEFENTSFLDEKSVLIGGLIVVTLVAFLASFLPTRSGHPGSLAASVFVFIVGSIFIGFCFLIYRLVRKNAEQKLNTVTGEVRINETSVNVNGVYFDWNMSWSRPEITKSHIHIGSEKMLLLHLRSARWIHVKGGREKIEKTCLVPVPPGKESEAQGAIVRITGNNIV